MLKATRPRLTPAEAKQILLDGYDVEADGVSELPSERDQNFLVDSSEGRLVLKIANAAEPPEIIDFQNQALTHISEKSPELPVPRLRRTRAGERSLVLKGGNLCRLLDYLDGKPLARARPASPHLLRDVGRVMGRIDVALRDFSHRAQTRYLYWDSRHAVTTIDQGLPFIEDDYERAWVERVRAEFDREVVPRLDSLPTGVIHNDANDHNVIVEGRGVTGLLDFGDMVESCLVFEVANAAAYCMLGERDPLRAGARVVEGYHEERPLTDEELEVLYLGIRARLAMSVANCARQAREEPDEEYLRISEQTVKELVRSLDSVSNRWAHYLFRDACGRAPHPRGDAAARYLDETSSSVLSVNLSPESVHVLDLSIGSTELGGLDVLGDVESFSRHVFDTIQRAGAHVGVGRYAEARPLYTSPGFMPRAGEGFETRTVHLGVDLFVEAGTAIRAPLAGTVHSFRFNDQPLDYGPTILLEHRFGDDDRLWTLYGHLSLSSLEGLKVGDEVERGQVLGAVGNYPVNGNWPPHLHFQILLDPLDMEGDFPGVARPSDQSVWLGLCPDPSRLAGLAASAAAPPPRARDDLARLRRDHVSKSLSVSYREPLHIVRGFGPYLYDESARAYLDLVNNVCHVGHCHPHVVRAAQKQVAVLNTNTRYLHENLVDYASRLTATLPDSLEVCFFRELGERGQRPGPAARP